MAKGLEASPSAYWKGSSLRSITEEMLWLWQSQASRFSGSAKKKLQLVTLWSYVHFREMLTLLNSGNHLQVWEEMHLSRLAMPRRRGRDQEHQDMQVLEANSVGGRSR